MFVYEYILTHPREGDAAAVFGVRSTGKLVHFGEIQARGENAAVQLRAVDARGVMALEFQAELLGAEGALVIRQAFCAPPPGTRKNAPSSPRRDSEHRRAPLD